MTGRVHVVGAGLAGLAAALTLAQAGRPVTIYEAAQAAGGRCRSYLDRELGLRVDNGNHLLLSGNRAAFGFLRRIGALDTLAGPATPAFPFMDLASGAHWVVRPSAGRIPWWLLSPARRVPGTRARDYLALLALLRARPGATVRGALPDGALYRRLLEPLAISALNTPPEDGLASLLAAVVRETLMQGGAACLPRFPRQAWSETLIDPALGRLAALGAVVQFARRIAALRHDGARVVGLDTPEGPVDVAPDESVVLAVPPWVAADLLPGLRAPDAFQAILNVHFALAASAVPSVLAGAGFLGLLGGTAEWVFAKPGHLSVTVSAANRLVDQPAEAIAATVWQDLRAVLPHAQPMPAWRVVKEKRATFAATAAQEARRPPPRTACSNLALAGDWTATGLPATIEGAIRSGESAAQLLLDGHARGHGP